MSVPIHCPEMDCGAFIREVGMGFTGTVDVDCPGCAFEGTLEVTHDGIHVVEEAG